MRKRDLQRLLDEAESKSMLDMVALKTAKGQLREARETIDRLSKAPAEHGFVRIHQTEGKPTLEGVLVAREPQYVLRSAAMLESADRTIDLDGTIEVPREHVAFVQLLGTLGLAEDHTSCGWPAARTASPHTPK